MKRLLLLSSLFIGLTSAAQAQVIILPPASSTSGGGGSGDVVGPASASDNDNVCFDGTTGKLIKSCAVSYMANTAHVLTSTNDSLSNQINLGALTTGLLKQSVSGGVATLSIYGGNTCTNQFPRSDNASGSWTCASVSLANDITGNLGVSHLNSGTSASSSTFWRGDGVWATPAGSGNVTGPGSSTAHNLTAFADTSGTLLEDSGIATSSILAMPASLAQGDLIYLSSSSALARLAKSTSADRLLCNTGSSNNPAWCQADLTKAVTGVLPVANGGTNVSSFGTGVSTSFGNNVNGAGGIAIVDGTKTFTNTTYDVEGTGNVFTFVQLFHITPAICQESTAYIGMSYISAALAPTAHCLTGTHVNRGGATFPDSDGEFELQDNLQLSSDWSGVLDFKGQVLINSDTNTGHVLRLQFQWACTATGEAANDTWSTAATVDINPDGTTSHYINYSKTSVTLTGCSASEAMAFRVMRQRTDSGDTLTGTFDLLPFNIYVRRVM